MILNFLKKKKLPKKILVLSALPYDLNSFQKDFTSGNSDFIASLKSQYNTSDIDSLWSNYQPYIAQMNKTFDLIRKYGGDVIVDFNLSDLQKLSDYDIVIVIAHHSDVSDEIEINHKLIRSSEFVRNIPVGCKIILDLTSCYSAHFIPWIKARIPESKIIGINCPTSLASRLKVITYIIIIMAAQGIDDYLTVFKSAWRDSGIGNASIIDNNIKLGSKFQSSLYAPSKAIKGEDFILSIFLHKSENQKEVEILAKSIDPEMARKNQLFLKAELKKDDLVEFQVSFNEKQYNGIEVDEQTKELYWDDNIESIEFIFSVTDEFDKKSFVGKIKLAVNKEPVGDMIFKINIVDDIKTEGVIPCCLVSFEKYDKAKDMNEHHQQLVNILEKKIKELAADTQNDSRSDIDMCKKCIDIIQARIEEKRHSPLRVFISSTSDMLRFRNIMKEQVESSEMYADMYERWGQGADYPRDMCCRHVLQSDIFVCILGAKYGFIEPIWDKSMTEIEYRVASNAGIPMLIYIAGDYKKKMSELAGEELAASRRQEALIDELRNKRLVCFFANELSLRLQSNTELITLKNRLL